ncbi:MAG: ATP-binding protein [Deltaproteobacteria bacterium]|nr:ATP-binding protein [Deltaproteobacteria bacterium]
MLQSSLAMSYRPFFETSQLPSPGPLAEDLRLDMKMMVAGQLENAALASDIAAFANTAGGVLLVGAHEHPKDSGFLHAYVPLTHAEANDVGTQVKQALGLCSPRPIAEAKPVALADGSRYVVAINCDPYAAPPIGVAQPGQRGGEKWWAFPVRRGRDTHNLRPEELATIMEPRLRRMLLLLDRIPRVAQNRSVARFHSSSGRAPPYFIVSFDAERSSVRLRGTQDPQEVVIPLDAVTMVWMEPGAEIYHVSLRGSIVETSTRELQFHP